MKVAYTSTQAGKYAKFIKGSFSWNFMEEPAIMRNLKPVVKSTTKALDAGCGTGHSTKLLLELGIRKENILGVDVSVDMLTYARKSLPGVRFTQVSLSELKLKENSLDLILSVMVFQFLIKQEYGRMITNFSRFLVKGGYLFFITLHPIRFSHDHKDYFKEKTKTENTPWGTKIEYQHRTFTDYITPLIKSSLELKLLEEITPVKSGAVKDTLQYEKYSSVPTRLAVMAIKK